MWPGIMVELQLYGVMPVMVKSIGSRVFFLDGTGLTKTNISNHFQIKKNPEWPDSQLQS